MKNFGLYVIMTDPVVPHEMIAESCVRHGVGMLQLREKEMSDREILFLAKRVKRITSGSKTRFIVNDRIDIALLADADGVHLGQDDLPCDGLRGNFSVPNDFIFGISTHNIAQAKAALALNPDYIGFGPVFPTFAKKKPDPVTGLEALESVIEISNVPVTAIGGINSFNIESVTECGAVNAAMISAVVKTQNYDNEIRMLAERLRVK